VGPVRVHGAHRRGSAQSLARSAAWLRLLVSVADGWVGAFVFEPEGFAIKERIRSESHRDVYLACRECDQAEAVVSVYWRHESSDARAERRSEEQAVAACAGPHVPEILGTGGEREAEWIALRREPSLPLSQWVRSSPPSIAAFLNVAEQLASVLVRVHAARLIHREIAPENLAIDPDTLETSWFDFSRARSLGAEREGFVRATDRRDPRSAYISPEQSGRMNRGVDSRSDLYSLGATLYWVLLGQRTFPVEDGLAFIHALLARTPERPSCVREDVPEPVSCMLLKLLSKEPADRYQSARSLCEDLGSLREELYREGALRHHFQLARGDAPLEPHFPPKLYARENEAEMLRAQWTATRRGETRLVLISGESGTGKSALVGELGPTIAACGGYLAVGKFDTSHDQPYVAWSAAIGSYAQQLLTGTDAEVDRAKREILEGTGSLARILTDLVPDLRFVLGELPPVPALGSTETRSRITLALKRLLLACATPAHPFVLFLDDLQWGDAASLSVLDDLLEEAADAALLIVAAYRSDAAATNHRLSGVLERISRSPRHGCTLHLGALPEDAIARMLADAFGSSEADVCLLARQIGRKTAGLPLLIRQMVSHMHCRGLIAYRDGAWRADTGAASTVELPQGAIVLLVAKLRQLDTDARQLISLASCIGNTFDRGLLAELAPLPQGRIERALHGLIDAGLVETSTAGLRFAHDRIRESAQLLLSSEERHRLHYEIAMLLNRRPEPEREVRLLEIADHLSTGVQGIPASGLPDAIQLLAEAGRSALRAGAPATADRHLTTAGALLLEASSGEGPNLLDDTFSRELLFSRVEAALLCSSLDRALQLVQSLLEQPLTLMDRARAQMRCTQILALTRPVASSASHLLDALAELGMKWPMRPSRLRTVLAVLRLSIELRVRGLDAVSRACEVPDPRRMAALLLLSQGAATLGRLDVNLATLVSCWANTMNLRFGHTGRPLYTLATFGVQLFLVLGDVAMAQRIFTLVRAGLHGDLVYGPRMIALIETTVSPFLAPRRNAAASARATIEAMLEVGDLEFANYTRFLVALYLALSGERIGTIDAQLHSVTALIRKAAHRYAEPELCHRLYRLLAADGPPAELSAVLGRIDDALADASESSVLFVSSMRLMVLCVFGHFELAVAESERVAPQLFQATPYVHIVDHCFFSGLAAGVLADAAVGSDRRRLRRMLRLQLARMRRWARRGPDFEHMECFLSAEVMRVRRRFDSALKLYMRSSELAFACGYVHHAGLASERRASLLAELRRRPEASVALHEARRAYESWGCAAKLRQIDVQDAMR